MFKKLMLGLAIASAAICSQASTLYWQVDTDPTEFSIATLYVTGNGVTKQEVTTVSAAGVDFDSTLTGTTTGAQQADISSWSATGYSFFVELATYSDGSWTNVKSGQTGQDWNGTWNYDDLVSQGYVSTGAISTPIAGMLNGGVNFGTQAPEPTSGLLLVLGGALLALRRRRS